MQIESEVIVRLASAALLGMALGAEREASDHDAGLRTQLMVATGAALFGVISTLGFQQYNDIPGATYSVDRVASTVVTGIGFIGAGVIFRRGNRVHNLTTAGSVWVAAAVGLSCGIGKIGPGVIATVMVLIALIAFRLPRKWLHEYVGWEHQTARVMLQPGKPLEPVEQQLRALRGVQIKDMSIEKEAGSLVISAVLRARPSAQLRDQLSTLAQLEDVDTLQLDEGYNSS